MIVELERLSLCRMLPAAANAGSWRTSVCLADAAANSEVCIFAIHLYFLSMSNASMLLTVISHRADFQDFKKYFKCPYIHMK